MQSFQFYNFKKQLNNILYKIKYILIVQDIIKFGVTEAFYWIKIFGIFTISKKPKHVKLPQTSCAMKIFGGAKFIRT